MAVTLPTTYNFPNHKKGDTFNGVAFRISIDGVYKSLVGATITMQLRVDPSDPDSVAVATFTLADGNFELDPVLAGRFEFKEQIVDVPAASYKYDIEIIYSDGVKKTYPSGKWKIIQDVSHV